MPLKNVWFAVCVRLEDRVAVPWLEKLGCPPLRYTLGRSKGELR